jgi:hypothetical protein
MLPTISEHVGEVPRVVRLKDCGVRGKVGVGCITMLDLPEVEVVAKPSELNATRYYSLLK